MPGQDTTASATVPQQATVSLRPLKPADYPLLAHWASTVPRINRIFEYATVRSVSYWVKRSFGKSRINMIMVGRTPVGFIALMQSKRMHVYVALDYRRRGYGTHAARQVIAYDKLRGANRIGVVAYGGADFYLKLGFKEVSGGRCFNPRDLVSGGIFLMRKTEQVYHTPVVRGSGRQPGINYLEGVNGPA